MTIIAQGRWRAKDPNPQQIPREPDRVTASECRATWMLANDPELFMDLVTMRATDDALDADLVSLDYADAELHYSDLLHDAGFDEHTGADTVLNPQHTNTMFLVGCMMMEQDDED